MEVRGATRWSAPKAARSSGSTLSRARAVGPTPIQELDFTSMVKWDSDGNRASRAR